AARDWSNQQGLPGAEVSASNAWSRLRATVDVHNDPGTFTSLIGWEWSSTPGGANLHRVIVSDADGDAAAQFSPLSSVVSPYPIDLWKWLDKTSLATGIDFVSIPHNSNLSKGFMFSATDLRGEPVNEEYAELRNRWERLAEATQIKGDSETHPALSPEDEFADFEHYPFYLQQLPEEFKPTPADYIRGGLKNGLLLEQTLGVNPFQFGLIGSTDSHTGLASAEEPNFWGKMAHDSVPETKQQDALAVGPTGWTMQAAGLAAVWADDNTRSAIVGAMRRRETYATTGPRIGLRLFAGYDFTEQDLMRLDFATNGYAVGVPMGGELTPDAQLRPPVFLVHAHSDPRSASLDRIQIVKGWLDAGEVHEKVFDVAWSGERQADSTGKLPSVGDTVNRSTGTWTNDIGEAALQAIWQDPQFKPDQKAFYYVRVLEIPTPRHALLDALALGMQAPTEGPSVIQERAYSSPVWYKP
ncbi:MAG: DUF3604 domain-containing protein, partial [Proteobacteria bacterium]|nr:DUF3604 domain-containing protein [Pseudomonadota bacterium]